MNHPKLSALLVGALTAIGTFAAGLLAFSLGIRWLATGDGEKAAFMIWIFSPVLILALLGSAGLGLWQSHHRYRRSLNGRHCGSKSPAGS
ncbi:hypothetical protein ASF27_02570 [Methylobacterium sp. Leaf102]|uniref:hypothetical protein n=1 Tax=unclassified Methylobacterium TaxID=2615210 RepID=UPI00070047D1|nr:MULTISPECIES: hypothetical protein [unclassified Methylobacterium]KQP34446.1 hypothetical protein ASF27_02570 [Methylobacterium sp. Leaf102]KQP36842.1 hypothetical protein ASF25_02575 [Methylobacterium sp. Leaf100]USU33552.1 hypothetical protein NG677_07760 [Methylobacterium sp. OTU13CASTA1]